MASEEQGSVEGENEEEVEEPVVPAAEEGSSTQVSPAEAALPPPKYEVLPGLHERFKGLQVKEVISAAMSEQLSGRTYRADQAARWSQQIANSIRQRVVKLCMNRYKVLVWVSVAEMRGAGLTCAARCVWDPDCDSYVHDAFQNSSLYAHAAVFGLYLY